YVRHRIGLTSIRTVPFHHLFIENIFPQGFYSVLRAHMLKCKYGEAAEDRYQDNPAFVTKRTNLFERTDEVTATLRSIFADADVKRALLKKFYVDPSDELVDALSIHEEFEYFYTKAGRFQNIHIDIPPKFLSFVFYIPEDPLPAAEEGRNATILYDKSLTPHYA